MLVLAFLGISVSPLNAQEASQYVKKYETSYRNARTLQARFLEKYSEGGRVERLESGLAYFRRPGKMRWEYESPEKNLFLVDGKTAWFYVPADHTVTRVPAKESTDWRTPLALLAGEMKVSRVCGRVALATNVKPESDNNVVLFCLPRGADKREQDNPQRNHGESSVQSGNSGEAAFFEITKNSGILVRVLVREPGDVELDFHFANWQFDPQIPDSFFRFSPPLGVAIVNAESPASNTAINQ